MCGSIEWENDRRTKIELQYQQDQDQDHKSMLGIGQLHMISYFAVDSMWYTTQT